MSSLAVISYLTCRGLYRENGRQHGWFDWGKLERAIETEILAET